MPLALISKGFPPVNYLFMEENQIGCLPLDLPIYLGASGPVENKHAFYSGPQIAETTFPRAIGYTIKTLDKMVHPKGFEPLAF